MSFIETLTDGGATGEAAALFEADRARNGKRCGAAARKALGIR